jgi:heme/copper-type cytochrome/quinol oxidase subunit 2
MKKPSPYLTFAGTIPFVLGAIFITVGIDVMPVLGKTEHVLSIYGLVIASFMAGAHWGNHLGLADDNRWAVKLPVFSNIIALALWLGFLSLSTISFIWLLVVGFIAMLVIDYGLHNSQIISNDYFTVRKYVTLIVIVSLIIAAVQL